MNRLEEIKTKGEKVTKAKRFVVVTTEHRGVFGGFVESVSEDARTVTLTAAQMCVYWSADVQGVVGLAAGGPTKSCKISPAAPKMTLTGVTAVMEATAAAQMAWQDRPWG